MTDDQRARSFADQFSPRHREAAKAPSLDETDEAYSPANSTRDPVLKAARAEYARVP
jgi:hypothetical protein